MTLSMLKPATIAVALASALALSGCPGGEQTAESRRRRPGPHTQGVHPRRKQADAGEQLRDQRPRHRARTPARISVATSTANGWPRTRFRATAPPGARSRWSTSAPRRCSTSWPNRPRPTRPRPAWRRSSATSGPAAWTRRRSSNGHRRRSSPPLDAIDALTDGTASIAGYMRDSAAKGQNLLFGFGPGGRLQEFHHEHRLRHAGRAGPARDAATISTRTRRTSSPPTRRISPRCCSWPGDGGGRGEAGQGRDRVRDAAGQGLAVEGRNPRRRGVLQPDLAGGRRQADAELLVDAVLPSQGVETPKMFSLAMPEFHEEVGNMLATCRSRHGNPTCASTPLIPLRPT